MNDLKEKIEKVDSRNEIKELLNGIYSQIASFDNKAAVLISIIGIVFALSFDALDIFKSITMMLADLKLWREFNYIMLGVYCLSFVLSIIFFILVIIPRSHKGHIFILIIIKISFKLEKLISRDIFMNILKMIMF